MRFVKVVGFVSFLFLSLGVRAQYLALDPAVKPGSQVRATVQGLPGQAFLALLDLEGGPVHWPGPTLYLGLTPYLTPLGGGTLDGNGRWQAVLPVPAGSALVGLALYGQGFLLDSRTWNLNTTDGASTVIYQGRGAVVHSFDNWEALGFTGDFDRTRRNRLMAGAVSRRLCRPWQKNPGLLFPQPVQSPFNPAGCRQQVVFTAAEMGGTGTEEVVTAVHWKPLTIPVQSDRFPRFALLMAHSGVAPDYSIDPFSALPKYPNSGLNLSFAANYKPGEKPLTVYDGSYPLSAAHMRPDGYLPYPAPGKFFTWNGTDSLLLEFKVYPTAAAGGWNGQHVQLMVTSMAQPNGRVQAKGSATRPVDPDKVTTADDGDNAMALMQIELTRVISRALSPWLYRVVPNPVYGKAIPAASVPSGASCGIEYRGAQDQQGTGSTPWSTSPAVANGMSYLQYRVTFRCDPVTGRRPSLDTLVIPIQ